MGNTIYLQSFGDVLQWYGIFEHPPQRFVFNLLYLNIKDL
jgi:hypothetical protein